MQMKLEVVCVPVADVERAKIFYADVLGFHVDHDTVPPGTDGVRIVQLTPDGSGCSIVLSSGLPHLAAMQPGVLRGLHLVVRDAEAARALLVERGVAVSGVEDLGRGVRHVSFSDPDGNTWVFQELAWRVEEFA